VSARYRVRITREMLAHLEPGHWPDGIVNEGLTQVHADGFREYTVLDNVAAPKWDGKLVTWKLVEEYLLDGSQRWRPQITEMWEVGTE
jgi:hypothetical protein